MPMEYFHDISELWNWLWDRKQKREKDCKTWFQGERRHPENACDEAEDDLKGHVFLDAVALTEVQAPTPV